MHPKQTYRLLTLVVVEVCPCLGLCPLTTVMHFDGEMISKDTYLAHFKPPRLLTTGPGCATLQRLTSICFVSIIVQSCLGIWIALNPGSMLTHRIHRRMYVGGRLEP